MFDKLKIRNLYKQIKPILDSYNIPSELDEYNTIKTSFFEIYYNHSNFYMEDKIYEKWFNYEYDDTGEFIPKKLKPSEVVEYIDNFLNNYYDEHLKFIYPDYFYIIPVLDKEKYSKIVYDLYLKDDIILNYSHVYFKHLTDEYKEKLEYLINAKKFDLI
jgi:hypothetical protein